MQGVRPGRATHHGEAVEKKTPFCRNILLVSFPITWLVQQQSQELAFIEYLL